MCVVFGVLYGVCSVFVYGGWCVCAVGVVVFLATRKQQPNTRNKQETTGCFLIRPFVLEVTGAKRFHNQPLLDHLQGQNLGTKTFQNVTKKQISFLNWPRRFWIAFRVHWRPR